MSKLSLSNRAINMPISPLRKLGVLAKERENQGIKVHYLNIGQPDFRTPDEFYKVVKDFDLNPVAYADSRGIKRVLDMWRKYYAALDIELEHEELAITVGASEAIVFVFSALCDPGDEIIVFEPFYANYRTLANLSGVRLTPVTRQREMGYHLPSDKEIEAAINTRTRAIMLVNPCNPTGVVYTREEIQRLVALAHKHDIFIIVDEVYRYYCYDNPMVNILTLPEAREHAIVIDSASKTFGLCGIRVGLVASHHEKFMNAVLKFCMGRLAVATLEQLALEPVLSRALTVTSTNNEEYKERRDLVYRRLRDIPGVKISKPEGAFYTFFELPVDSSESFCYWMITEFVDKGETVLLAPGPGFYINPGHGEREVRLAFVSNKQELSRSLDILEKALKQYPGKL